MLKKLYEKLWIYIVLALFSFWYLSNINGAFTHDEVIWVHTARSLANGWDMYIWPEHPRLSQYTIAAGLMATGWSPVGARLPAFVLGIIAIFLIYKTGEMLANRYIGLLAAIFTGSMKLFAQNAVVALLDMSSAFFVVLLFYLMTYYLKYSPEGKNRKILLVSIGIVSFCAIATRYVGIFFAAVAFVFIVQKKAGPDKIKENLRPAILFLSGFIVSFFIIYLPYMRFDTETIRFQIERYGSFYSSNPALTSLAEILPYLPGIFYLFARSIGANLFNLMNATGYPSWLSYFYWIWEYGGVTYTLGLILSVLAAYKLKEKYDAPVLFVMSYTIIPLLFLSLIGNKSLKYMLPFFPLFTVMILCFLYKFMELKLKLPYVAYIALIILFIIPSSPVFAIMQDPYIKTDTGYDIAAKEVTRYLNNTDKNELSMLVDSPHILEYYMEDDIKSPTRIELMYLTSSSHWVEFSINDQKKTIKSYVVPFWSNANNQSLYEQLKEDRFDLIITSGSNLVNLYKYIPPDKTSEKRLGGDLNLYMVIKK